MHQVETITDGECFGDCALITKHRKYITTVIAAVFVELLVLNRASFHKIFGDVSTHSIPWLSEMHRPGLKR